MLAVKLHENKNPFLGKGSYLIPVTTWKVAKSQIRNWLRVLSGPAKRGDFGFKRSFITLVKIPDTHPVRIDHDFLGSDMESPLPLKDIPKAVKKEIMEWYDSLDEPRGAYYLGAKSAYAQLILGAPLPKKRVKWTKDIRLLYRGDKRRHPSSGGNSGADES